MKNLFHCYVIIAGAALLLVTSGCNTVSSQVTQAIGGPTFPPSNPELVQILRTPPTRPHIRLGEIRLEPSSESVSVTKIEAALRNDAAKLGADAAVVVVDRTEVTGAVVMGPWYGRSIQEIQGRVVVAVAIKYQ